MSTDKVETSEDIFLYEAKNDLPSLACFGAIEIDKIILDKVYNLNILKKLADKLLNSIKSHKVQSDTMSLIDPKSVIVMNHAIQDSYTSIPRLKTVDDLVQQARKITEKLQAIVSNPDPFKREKREELKELRSFCIAISKHASSFERSLYNNAPRSY